MVVTIIIIIITVAAAATVIMALEFTSTIAEDMEITTNESKSKVGIITVLMTAGVGMRTLSTRNIS
jgi:hypothetical protein